MTSSLVATVFVLLLSISFGRSQNEETQFNFTNECMKIELQFETSITYEQTDNSLATITVPGTNFSSEEPIVPCDDDDMTSIDITWGENNDFTLTLDFVADINKTWAMSSLTLGYQTREYPDFKNPANDGDTVNASVTPIQNVPWGFSYTCDHSTSYKLTGGAEPGSAIVTFPKINVQVFQFAEPGNFSEATYCKVPPTNKGGNKNDDDKIVPIAVGCALAGLVIIVLIAYLIGRFRSRKTDTYQVLS